MGVSAVVYKRLEDVVFPAGADLNHLVIDDSTGEVYFDDASQVMETHQAWMVHAKERAGTEY